MGCIYKLCKRKKNNNEYIIINNNQQIETNLPKYYEGNEGSYIQIDFYSKCCLSDIKNINVIKNILNTLNKKKLLLIIKHNKRFQELLNITMDDYILHTNIVIEMKPIRNLKNNVDYKFINFPESVKKYYHIFFDDNKEEIRRKYLNKNDKVNKIKIVINYQVNSFENLFFKCKCIKSISFIHFYRNNITNMSGMFFECSSLKIINFINFNTENVIDMSCMFCLCSSLNDLNLDYFNFNNVISMRSMFFGCSQDLIEKIKNNYDSILDSAFY